MCAEPPQKELFFKDPPPKQIPEYAPDSSIFLDFKFFCTQITFNRVRFDFLHKTFNFKVNTNPPKKDLCLRKINATLDLQIAPKSKTTKENGKGFDFAHAQFIIFTCVERMVECTPEARVNIALPWTHFYLSNLTACNGKTLLRNNYCFHLFYVVVSFYLNILRFNRILG